MTFAADEPGRRRRVSKKRIVMGEINIVSQPHTLDLYIEAFKELHQAKSKVLYHGHRYIEIGTCRELDDVRLPNALTGHFFVFSQINFDDPWLNMLRNAEATDTELNQLNIPPHLAPEFRRFRYVFDCRKHILYFEKFSIGRQHLSPKAFAQSLNRLLHEPILFGKFKEINAFTVPDEQAIETILTLNKLRRLFMRLHRPNPDDDDFEKGILNQLNTEHVGVQETNLLKAPREPAIAPSEFTKKIARLSAKFGHVIGWGKDKQNAPIKVDTESHPKEHNIIFKETEDALEKMVQYIYEKNQSSSEVETKGDA
jgi:hypothetical protein